MPLVSVLIPCHNAASWLRSALESVSRQSHQELEILVYDDGSTDASTSITSLMAAKDRRIIVMGEARNRGIVHALNAMLRVARGRYIARMDADDICLPQRIERQLHFTNQGGVDLCGSWFREFGGGVPRNVCWNGSAEELRAALLFQNTILHPTVFARREVFEDYAYREDYNLAEDYDLFVRALSRFRLANVPEVLLHYRRHPAQATKMRRAAMENVTCRIRIEALQAQGIEPSHDEQRVHNLVRAPRSINSMDDLEKIEEWLLKIQDCFDHPEARKVVARQWTRAAIRAAPLGWKMWRTYRRSPLYQMSGGGAATQIDMIILAAIRLDYGSRTFDFLRRFGISA